MDRSPWRRHAAARRRSAGERRAQNELKKRASTCTRSCRSTNARPRSCSRRTRRCSPRTRSTQSINEELETAKEELQSANEELSTINLELQERNRQLGTVNDDLLNLLTSVNIPLMIVGPDLRLRRFTPAAEKLFGLIRTDVGRPLSDLRSSFDTPKLEAEVLETIETMQPREREVVDRDGRFYSLQIRPTGPERTGSTAPSWCSSTSTA